MSPHPVSRDCASDVSAPCSDDPSPDSRGLPSGARAFWGVGFNLRVINRACQPMLDHAFPFVSGAHAELSRAGSP